MRKTLSAILLTFLAFLAAGCGSSDKKGGKAGEQEAEQTFVTEESLEYTELKKVQLPCDKDLLYNAWKQIGVVELQRKKVLDYDSHTPTLFLSTDLDKDGNPEVLLRSEPPYAAIYTFVKDSLQLITYVDQAQMGLAITPDGTILRNGIGAGGSTVSEFIRLEDSQPAATGAVRETFNIQNGAMVSGGTQYMLMTDSALAKVSKEEFEKVAPQQNGTYLEDIDGWEDFRKP
ncbi:MAG: hypothetical protein J6W03_05275 [Bacteroidaceae bacterium]|nr:hypothetical protein [Bacteroidaceae bacterium]